MRYNIHADQASLDGASSRLEVLADYYMSGKLDIKPHEDKGENGEKSAEAHDNCPANRLRQDGTGRVKKGCLVVELAQPKQVGCAGGHIGC